MPITKADVLLIAPELTDITDEQWSAFIADAYSQLSEKAWGRRLDLAAKYLVAHIASVAAGGGTATTGPIQSETVGAVSRTYASAGSSGTTTPGALGSTTYGAEYARLLRGLGLRMVIV